MKFTYKKYRNIQWHAHDHHFGEISLFVAKILIFSIELLMIGGIIISSGKITGDYIIPFIQKILV